MSFGNDQKTSSSRLLPSALLIALVVLVGALSTRGSEPAGWTGKEGYYFYRGEDGTLAKGLTEIDGKMLFFGSNGAQLHGWRKVDDKYLHFRFGDEENGCADADTTINGIVIGSDGLAVIDSDAARAKAETMVCYSEWTDRFIRPDMTRRQKLYACLFELRKFPYRAEGDEILNVENWDVICARELYLRRNKERYANCYRYAAGFSYMANAIGFTDVKSCAMWGHGWTMIDGDIYDVPHTIRLGNEYFPVPKDQHDNFPAAYVRDMQLM